MKSKGEILSVVLKKELWENTQKSPENDPQYFKPVDERFLQDLAKCRPR